jgi:hypothetical protein
MCFCHAVLLNFRLGLRIPVCGPYCGQVSVKNETSKLSPYTVEDPFCCKHFAHSVKYSKNSCSLVHRALPERMFLVSVSVFTSTSRGSAGHVAPTADVSSFVVSAMQILLDLNGAAVSTIDHRASKTSVLLCIRLG